MATTDSAERLAAARSFLFVPGDRPDRFAKAQAASADVVILDLEDAVAPDRKAAARDAVAAWLAEGHPAMVRVNAAASPHHPADLEVVGNASAIMVAKAESPDDCAPLDLPAVPLIETARGLGAASEIMRAPGVARAALGTIDLALDLGVDPHDGTALLWARSSLVVAAAAAGKAGPIDGVTTRLDDEATLVSDVRTARRLGLTAKLCIHPRQIEVVHREFAPTPAERQWAATIAAAAPVGAQAVDGQLVDAPVLARARRILAQARD